MNAELLQLAIENCLYNKDYKKAINLIGTLPDPQKSNLLEKILMENFIENGLINEAKEFTALLNRELTAVELEKMLSFNISCGFLKSSLEIVKLLNRELAISELELIFKVQLGNYSVEDVFSVVELFPKELTGVKLNYALAHFIELPSLEQAQKIVESLNRELTGTEINKLFTNSVGKGGLDDIFKVALILPEPQKDVELKKLLTDYIELGLYYESLKVAKALGRELNISELEKIFKLNLSKGYISLAIEMLTFFPEERKNILLVQILDLAVKEGNEHDITKTLKLFSGQEQIDKVQEVIIPYVKDKKIEKAKRIVKILPEIEQDQFLDIL